MLMRCIMLSHSCQWEDYLDILGTADLPEGPLAAGEIVRRATAAAAELACSQEPIHIPGTIQPHGALLALEPSDDWNVVAASRNAAEMLADPLGTNGSIGGGIIGRSAASVLGRMFTESVQRRFRDGKLRGESPWQSTFAPPGNAPAFNVSVHRHAGLVLVELERAGAHDGLDAQAALRRLRGDLRFACRNQGRPW